MATSPPKPPRMKIERPTPADRHRWSMWKLDKTIEEIAAREKIAIRFIQASIDKVEEYRLLPTSELLQADIHATSMEMLPEWGETVRGATRAKKYRTKANGREQIVVDHETRLAAAREIREMTGLTVPKGGPGVQVNVQNNNSGAHRPGGGMDFESRLRILRAKNAGSLPGTVQLALAAPEERSPAERLADDMKGAGLELEESELRELEGHFDDEGGDGSEESTDDDDKDGENETETQGPAQSGELDKEWT